MIDLYVPSTYKKERGVLQKFSPNTEGYLPLFELKQMNHFSFHSTALSTKKYEDIVSQTFGENECIAKIKTYTGDVMGVHYGFLCKFINTTQFEIIYSYVGHMDHRFKIAQDMVTGYTEDIDIQLWVRENYESYGPTLSKLIKQNAIDPAISKSIPVVYKQNFKEFFTSGTEKFSSIKDLLSFEERMKEELLIHFT